MRLWAVAVVPLLTGCAGWTAPVREDNPERESYDEWIAVELDGTRCSDGSQYRFFVNFSETSDDLVIAFEPGGACWDFESCRPGGSIRGAANPEGIGAYHAIALELGMPVISRTHGDNELSDFNFVSLPYCTGDVFAGDRVSEYESADGETITFHHAGHTNMVAVIDWLDRTFVRVPRLLVTGISAGGVGSLVNYHFIRTGMSGVERGYLLDDSGPFFPQSTHSAPLYDKVYDAWNIAGWLDDASLPAGFDVDDFGSINHALADAHPDDRLAHTFFRRDYNFSLYSYETFYGFPPKEQVLDMWWEDAQKLIAQAETRDNLAVFIPFYRELNCSHGTTLVEHRGTQIEALNMDIGDFIRALMDDTQPLRSYVEEAQPDEDREPSPECEMVPAP